jgi:hypothetical protein
MKGRIGEIAFIFLTISFLMTPCFLGAEEGIPLREKGTQEIGFGSGYGWSIESNRHVESVPLNLRWGCVLTEPKGSSFLKGNWELLLEGSVSYLFHNQRKYGLGANGLIRYNFLSGKRLVPFLQAGFGVWHSNLDMHNFPNDFNFCSQGGGGLQYFIKKDMAIQWEYRLQHFSNASLKDNNAGLNLSNFWIGCAYFF